MTQFEALFGIKKSQVKKNCVILPLLMKGALEGFGIRNFSRARLYGAGFNDDFTLIHSGLGVGLTGDAILHLEDTPCRNVVLFGSCGLVREAPDLNIGSLVTPVDCYAQESFSELLKNKSFSKEALHPDSAMLGRFSDNCKGVSVREVTCLTISSLKLEEEMTGLFVKRRIDVVDMECSAFFNAAAFTKIKALALFYASDIILKEPFYLPRTLPQKAAVASAIKNAAGLICELLKKS